MADLDFLESLLLKQIDSIPELTKWGKGRPSKEAIEKRNKEIELRSEWSKRNLPFLNEILNDNTQFIEQDGKRYVKYLKRF